MAKHRGELYDAQGKWALAGPNSVWYDMTFYINPVTTYINHISFKHELCELEVSMFSFFN